MNNQVNKCLNTQFQGFYKAGIVNPVTGEVKWQTDEWQKNLILNQGLDHIATTAIVEQFLVSKSGAGSRPNSIDGGTSEITQSGAIVYLNVRTGLADFTSSNGTYPASVQVGDMIKYANNSESMVTTVTNGFNLQVTPSYTITSGQTFDIWKTSQTGLESAISNSTSIFVGAGDGTYCGTTTVGNVRTHRRTFDFPIETSQTTYNEIGVGWNTSNLFSRILLVSPLILNTGLQLRFIYELQTTWTPIVPVYKSAGIGNWPVSPSTDMMGSESLQILKTSTVNSANGASAISDAGALDPYFISNGGLFLTMWGSTTSTALAAFGSAVVRTSSGTTANFSRGAYTNGTYTVDKTGVFPISQLVSSGIRSIGLGDSGNTGQSYAFVFDQPQAKNSAQTLSITFRHSWSRILS